MGIKFNESTSKWEAFYCKRHPQSKKPTSLRRVGIDTKRDALRIEKELVVELNEKFNAEVVPNWQKLVEDYYSWQKTQNISLKTAENYYLCLKVYWAI